MSEFDDTLTQLFAAARESLPAEDFVESVATHVSQARRKRAIGRAALTLAAAGLAVAATPYVAAGSLAVVSHLAPSSPVLSLCSMALAAWGVRRARRMS